MSAKKKTTVKSKSTRGSSKAKSQASVKMLTRSKTDRIVTGVLGGISSYFNVDSTVLRLAWIAIVAFTGFVPGLVAYAVATLVMPEK